MALQKLRSPLHFVHANLIGGGFKRHRFRESQMWLYDKPAYYNVDHLLSFDMRTLQPPADWLQLNTRHRVQFHLENIGTQLQQVPLFPWGLLNDRDIDYDRQHKGAFEDSPAQVLPIVYAHSFCVCHGYAVGPQLYVLTA